MQTPSLTMQQSFQCDRRRKSARTCREQVLRAEGRTIQQLLRSFAALGSHRGGRVSALGAALAAALTHSHAVQPSQPAVRILVDLDKLILRTCDEQQWDGVFTDTGCSPFAESERPSHTTHHAAAVGKPLSGFAVDGTVGSVDAVCETPSHVVQPFAACENRPSDVEFACTVCAVAADIEAPPLDEGETPSHAMQQLAACEKTFGIYPLWHL